MGLLDRWRFCPRCRAELERGEGRVTCPACGFVFYANSQPTAGALCVDGEGRLLLVRREAQVFHGFWDLPGGFLEEGEHPLAALIREVREETGLDVEPGDFVGVWTDWYSEAGEGEGVPATLNLYWTARVLGGEARAADDVSELGWFARDELPPAAEIAFRNVAEVVSTWLARHQQP